jgi:predicted CoA-substrate-specific enzyme activase
MGKNLLAIDVGSVAASMVVLDPARQVLRQSYLFHQGRIAEGLPALMEGVEWPRVGWVAVTGSTPVRIRRSAAFDDRLATIAAARHLHPGLGAILTIGGERFGLITFTPDHEYRDARGNSSCAAGTGSFLDEQAENLGLAGSAELSAAAERSVQPPPRIASRCAVFAKTDVTHAQQEGHSREAICDGLCLGLATTVADALFSGEAVPAPIVLTGGVARNAAVVRHLKALVGSGLVVDDWAHLYGALGAGLLLHAELAAGDGRPPLPPLDLERAEDLVLDPDPGRAYAYPSLDLDLPGYPDFNDHRTELYLPRVVPDAPPVEVDDYLTPAPGSRLELFLGLDIGSTSTKAALVDRSGAVVAGFYTRTTGRPLVAAQALFEAAQAWAGRLGAEPVFLGAAATGAGRKFIAAVIGADLVVDEITAHAKAACALDPEVDTILEIGGQDAKFTTLRQGMVTSAVMNTVCAAGTGTFIEEQAHRLATPLEEIPARVGPVRSPRASDRCTVFMHRDINHLLAGGYSVPETLAAVLHSVRENYLRKVAQEGAIGQRICFQGATARNRALVAAFAQKLGRPIRVSRYCHLAGALGAALILAEDPPARTAFRGLGLHRERIPIAQETCSLCANGCRILVAEVGGAKAAYGFLCGRDYGVDHFVPTNTSGFDLLKARRKVARPADIAAARRAVTVGILTGLQFFEEADRWQRFFAELGVRTLTVPWRQELAAEGRKLAGAEFCAPMAVLHAQAVQLAERADCLFLPLDLASGEQEGDLRRQYCYYSQFATTLIAGLDDGRLRGRLAMPRVTHGLGALQTKLNLLSELKPLIGDLGFSEVSTAYDRAVAAQAGWSAELRKMFVEQAANLDDVAVVLIGRPYLVLAPAMNKGIPDLFATLGVKTFFQDMLSYGPEDLAPIEGLLRAVHWHYAAKILEAAQVAAATPGLYPVWVTSFRCAPDACVQDYFKAVCERQGKPYLVLQLDDHASAVGYETRIEAAVRAFRNHRAAAPAAPRQAPTLPAPPATALEGRTLLFPCWDRLTCSLLVANLEGQGVDARLMREDPDTVGRALAGNSGQCLPLHIIAQTFVDHVRRLDLDPERTALWVGASTIACHIGMYPYAIQSVVAGHGGGFGRARVYAGEMSLVDFSLRAAFNGYFCHLFGGMLRRMACRVRPYELAPGAADRAQEEGLAQLEAAFRKGLPGIGTVREVAGRFARIPVRPGSRPKVAILGDLYARDNEVLNRELVRTIEANGGEVITTPYTEYVKNIAGLYLRRWLREGHYLSVLKSGSLLTTLQFTEKKYLEAFTPVLGPPPPDRPATAPEAILARFHLTPYQTGETFDNILNIFHLLECHPDLDLLVHTSPAFCCPSLVTEALAAQIERATGVPMVSLTYDGTGACPNDLVIPYLKLPRKRRASVPARP